MSIRRIPRQTDPSRHGQSLVELSLALPLLLFLMLGTLDIGRAFFDYIELRNAAREGAGYGARNPHDGSGIVARVTDHGVPADTAVTVSCSGACAIVPDAGTISVTAARTFTPVSTDFLQRYMGIAPFRLSATATMRILS